MVPQLKTGVVTLSTSITNGATFTSGAIDTLGADYGWIQVRASTQSASTQAGSPSVLKLQEADVTNSSSFADIVGARGASATATNVDFLVGVGVTSGTNNAYQFDIDCRARKRYIQVVASPTTTQTFEVAVFLGR